MIEKVVQTITKYQMLSRRDKVIVGFSGGADSVALLHVLKELKPRFEIELFAVHINHGIRGQAADEDADFARGLCKKWGIPFFEKKVNIPSLAKSKGLSEEEAGRLVRYDFFQHVSERVGGNKIATGHHKNDQAETILLNLIRGTGMQGLTGIPPVDQRRLIRPLIEVTRQEITDYLRRHNLSYREDASNEDIVYTRNRIRNQLMPYLAREFNPDIVESLTRMADILREEENFLADYVKKVYHNKVHIFKDLIKINLQDFTDLHTAVQKRLIRSIILQLRGSLTNVANHHVEAVLELAEGGRTGSETGIPGTAWGEPRLEVEVSYGFLIFRKENKEKKNTDIDFMEPLSIPGKVSIKALGQTIRAEKWDRNWGLAHSPECIYINADRIKGGLWLRFRRDGDRFKPFGMSGTKKLKDFFIDRKVPAARRMQIPLLVDEESIIWVVGFQISEDYKITDATENIVRIYIENQNS
ncbi:MAG: tRNA lysidine(34) synthetase TilS [Caldicoprobacterales bacterium]|jgi:tRNA(Ile)-lysidine synthase|nr:tRNA lysidine(34) synthetase TilS [Clostridiales bacterium]